MTTPRTCLYVGEIVHKRLTPVRHELRYKVFNVFIAVDELETLAERTWLLGYNRHRPLGICDRHHGTGDGSKISKHLQDIAGSLSEVAGPLRFFMFCYPSLFGFVFNPLTVYYGYDTSNRLRLMIYEVNNTFGDRRTYVVPVGKSPFQTTRKTMHVSPFNRAEGSYGFHPSPPCETVSLGITLRTDEGPVMKAYFTGSRLPLNGAMLIRCLALRPFQVFKVVAAIHWEAAKLWLKGLRTHPRPMVKPLLPDEIRRPS